MAKSMASSLVRTSSDHPPPLLLLRVIWSEGMPANFYGVLSLHLSFLLLRL